MILGVRAEKSSRCLGNAGLRHVEVTLGPVALKPENLTIFARPQRQDIAQCEAFRFSQPPNPTIESPGLKGSKI
jgi:hypothetical protein